MSVFVVVADTDPEGPSDVVAVARTRVAALVIAKDIPYGRVEEAQFAETTMDAQPVIDRWHRLNPGWTQKE